MMNELKIGIGFLERTGNRWAKYCLFLFFAVCFMGENRTNSIKDNKNLTVCITIRIMKKKIEIESMKDLFESD